MSAHRDPCKGRSRRDAATGLRGGAALPGALDIALRAFPTSQGMRIMTNGLAGRPLFPDLWIAYAVLIVWVAVAYGLLAWRLARRES